MLSPHFNGSHDQYSLRGESVETSAATQANLSVHASNFSWHARP